MSLTQKQSFLMEVGGSYNVIIWMFPSCEPELPVPIFVAKKFVALSSEGLGFPFGGIWSVYTTPMRAKGYHLDINEVCDFLTASGKKIKVRFEEAGSKELSFIIDMLTGMREEQIDILNIHTDEDKENIKKLAKMIDSNAHVRFCTNPSGNRYAFVRIPISPDKGNLVPELESICKDINTNVFDTDTIPSETIHQIKAYVNKRKVRDHLTDHLISVKMRTLERMSRKKNPPLSNISEEITRRESLLRQERALLREEKERNERMLQKQRLIRTGVSRQDLQFSQSGPSHTTPKKKVKKVSDRDDEEKVARIRQSRDHQVYLFEKEKQRIREIEVGIEKIRVGDAIMRGD